MTRLFFDIVGKDMRSLDYHGRYFTDIGSAKDQADLLSLDLSCSIDYEWAAAVEVRNVDGQRVYSVDVETIDKGPCEVTS